MDLRSSLKIQICSYRIYATHSLKPQGIMLSLHRLYCIRIYTFMIMKDHAKPQAGIMGCMHPYCVFPSGAGTTTSGRPYEAMVAPNVGMRQNSERLPAQGLLRQRAQAALRQDCLCTLCSSGHVDWA